MTRAWWPMPVSCAPPTSMLCGDPPEPGCVLACNDDGPDCAGFTSLMVIPDVVQGQEIKLAIGGFAGAQGTGTITITCTP